MVTKNQISFQLSEPELSEIQNAITILQEKLLPKLKSLTVSERTEIPKMGDKTLAFVTKANEYIHENPHLVPPYIDKDSLQKDIEAVTSLRQLQHSLMQILDQVNDSILLSGSDAYSTSLMFYNSIKSATKNNIPNAKIVYEDLNKRFNYKNRKKNPTNNEAILPS